MTARRVAAATSFRAGHARADRWQDAVDEALAGIGPAPRGANLGFVYMSDRLGGDAAEVLGRLRDATGVEEWIGTVGVGVLASGVEYLDESALAVMLAVLPPGEFQVFSGKRRPPVLGVRTASGAEAAHFAIVHGDPETDDMPELIQDMSGKVASGYLVGGLSSSRSNTFQVANEVLSGGLSGVVLSSRIEVATRLTQGCSPLRSGPGTIPVRHVVTEGDRNLIAALDGRPALDVLREDIGAAFGGDLRRAAQGIHVGLPVAGSDTGDYLVRNLVGIDPKQKVIAIGALVEAGMQVMFCRRDGRPRARISPGCWRGSPVSSTARRRAACTTPASGAASTCSVAARRSSGSSATGSGSSRSPDFSATARSPTTGCTATPAC